MTVSFASTQERFHRYSFLVEQIAQKISFKNPLHGDVAEMMQYGYIGLIEAIDAFPAEKGLSFETYASICIQERIVKG